MPNLTPARFPVRRFNVMTGAPLNLGGRTPFSTVFPAGRQGIYGMKLRFNLVVTIGTGTTPIAEGELAIIRGILVKSDRSEQFFSGTGKWAYKITARASGSPPRKDAIAASSATYRVDVLIPFADMTMLRPEDTILDMSRYQQIFLEISYGTVADLFATVGTSSITATVDCDLIMTTKALPDAAKPQWHPYYNMMPTVDAFSQQYQDLERSPDLFIKRVWTHWCTGGTAGLPWYGVNSDAVGLALVLNDQEQDIVHNAPYLMVQNQNKDDYMLESVLSGVTVNDFVTNRSNLDALVTDPRIRSLLRLNFTAQGGLSAGSIVSPAIEGFRTLKAA